MWADTDAEDTEDTPQILQKGEHRDPGESREDASQITRQKSAEFLQEVVVFI